jgi:hypothetical protein
MRHPQGVSNTNEERENIFKQKTGNENLNENNNDNGVRVVNFATLEKSGS